MADFSEKLVAYLDGELSPEEAAQIEAQIEADPQLADELEALMAGDQVAKAQFDDMLKGPVPLNVVRAISAGPSASSAGASDRGVARPTPLQAKPARVLELPVWQAMAAGLALFVVGGGGSYVLTGGLEPKPVVVAKAGWLTAIADYHAVYAKQKRHLVEVAADEVPHIEKWLGKTTAVKFTVPKMDDLGLKFEGARLLVVGGAPVAQLMYTDLKGDVIALCFKQKVGATGDKAAAVFKEKTIKAHDFVSWAADGAAYVVVGPKGQDDLRTIAAAAATRV